MLSAMAIQPSERTVRPTLFFSADPRLLSVRILSFAAVVYAFLAGFHTVQDFDLGWQLATGRWVVQHHRVFSVDVFSYTASGQPWIYPVLSGTTLYLVYLTGGYALLTWLGAFASAGTVALLLRRNSLAVAALALVAAPLIANRTQPRAEMFTTVFFPAFLTLLWRYHRSGNARLWLLPVLMVLWVNLHPGFVAGIALCLAYVLLELLSFPIDARSEKSVRLRKACPWLAATVAATLINPWGPFVYSAVWMQQRAQALHTAWVVEWQSVRVSWANLIQALQWRDPQSSFWWLALVAVVAIGIALWRRQWGAVLLLAAAVYLGIQHMRLQALFACIVVVVGGGIVEDLVDARTPVISKVRRKQKSHAPNLHWSTALALGLSVVLLVLTGLRSADLISNRYYMRSNQLANFGSGLSWWYPQRAVDFIVREKLPGNIFNGYALGGYLTWRLFPAYRDYIDSRALPFGPDLFFRAYDLGSEPPNSPAWQLEADARGINTILVPLSRYQGMTLFPHLSDFCRSKVWKPVYVDGVAGVFVRVTPQSSSLLSRLQIDCGTLKFTPPTRQTKSSMFNFAANAGGVLYSLERYPEALTELDRAQSLFADNASVHLFRGLVFQQMGQDREAETEFRTSVQLEPSDQAWFDLGLFYMTQKRYSEAVEVFRQSTENSSRPHEMWMMLGQAYLGLHDPQRALEAFDKAVESSPFGTEGKSLGATFYSFIATGRAKAWFQLGDVAKAVGFQEEAVRIAPQDGKLWLGLSNLYQVQGQISKASEARMRANALAH